MKSVITFIPPAAVFLVACACGPAPDIRSIYETDCRSPEIITIVSENSRSLKMVLDEEAELAASDLIVTPPLAIESVRSEGKELLIRFSEAQVPGASYLMEGRIKDSKGNTLHFLNTFYGKNDEIPGICINEFTVKGSGSHPDSVELAVLSDGNIAGLTLLDGMDSVWNSRIILPPVRVRKGDFLIVHFKPQGISEEKDEVSDKNSSSGYDSSDTAFDFWVPGGTGLSSNNGLLVLYDAPAGGVILDAVAYSNRTSESDSRYGGFGSAAFQTSVEALVECGAWEKTGTRVVPEDAVNPELSTGTRSICRDELSSDTDSKDDWKIVRTRGITFGRPNTSPEYTPE